MNYFIRLLLAGSLLVSGCATNDVLNKTHSHYEPSKNRMESDVEVAGSSGYYALLPLSVAFDIATSPVQLAIFLIEGPGVKDIPSNPKAPPAPRHDETSIYTTPPEPDPRPAPAWGGLNSLLVELLSGLVR